jgi:hypothetical protein
LLRLLRPVLLSHQSTPDRITKRRQEAGGVLRSAPSLRRLIYLQLERWAFASAIKSVSTSGLLGSEK